MAVNQDVCSVASKDADSVAGLVEWTGASMASWKVATMDVKMAWTKAENSVATTDESWASTTASMMVANGSSTASGCATCYCGHLRLANHHRLLFHHRHVHEP